MIFWQYISYLYIYLYIYNHNNLSSLIICRCISCNMYFSFGIPLGAPINFSYLCADGYPIKQLSVVTFSAIWHPTKSPVSSTIFWIPLFETVFSASVADLFVLIDIFVHNNYSDFCPHLLRRVKTHNLRQKLDL